ncbi:hypothetical protein ARAM_004331 [Aspergillus rambellii]|uniref:Mitochondrial import inner membrane translocase subunit TIM54 n=1 Tax=Aspergillus rambellii TaxID=308745 RepID=A0A0F8UX20_9EURO|nr:hypothetical protein ARAM_004331 [Aspergillus rambellii]
MAESSTSAAASAQTQSAAPKSVPKPQNPALKMMGLPHFRFKLPSRNWMIFLTITGSFTAAIIYDPHLSKEALPIEETRRKLTVFLSAPPGDGLRTAREHFKEYVKPILVAAALDYNVIEGRREGDVRAAFAEQIRKQRRRAGEPSSVTTETTVEDVVAEARKSIGVKEEPGPRGDLVIGRHTWKEYIRGLHEGWLGPLDPPQPPVELPTEQPTEAPAPTTPPPTEGTTTATPETPGENKDTQEPKKEEEKKPEKPKGPTPAYLAPVDYSSQPLPPSMPSTLDGANPISFPHILGFLNTPIRIYRYLNQRHLADSVGRDVAGIVLASYARPYDEGFSTPSGEAPIGGTYEQQSQLEEEEGDWHKSVHKKDEANPDKEREWLDDITLDPRIAGRMQRYVLSPEEEARAERIVQGTEYILGEERPEHVSFWQRAWIKYGYGEDPEVAKRKPILGNLDGEE